MDVRWYDRECVPFARSLAGTIREGGTIRPELHLLEVRATFPPIHLCGKLICFSTGIV